MANLELKGRLNLLGTLTLEGASGGKVTIDGKEIIVEKVAGQMPPHGQAPPVTLPPPAPVDAGPNVYVINSFNKTVKVGTQVAVAQGMLIQGLTPTWPGMVLPSQNNTSPVSASGLPINVKGDKAIVFPSGGSVTFDESGQP